MRAPARGEQFARREILLQRAGVERGGHDDEPEFGPVLFLKIESAGEGDVAVEMSLVKLVEDDRADAAQRRIGEHLAKQHAFGHEADACPRRADAIEPNLITDFVPKPNAALLRDTRREHARGESSRLEHDDLSVAGEPVIEQHLRNLRGFARAGRRLQHETRVSAHRFAKGGFEFVRWEALVRTRR